MPGVLESEPKMKNIDAKFSKPSLLDKVNQLPGKPEGASLAAAASIVLHFRDGYLQAKDEDEKQNDLSKDLDYVLKRLVSGLTSSEHRSRYYACLRELLESVNEVNPFHVLELADSSMKITQGLSKKERGEFNLGRVMTATLCIDTGLDNERASLDDWKRLVGCLFEVLGEKKFVSFHAAESLAKLLLSNPFGEKSDEIHEYYLERIKEESDKAGASFDLVFLAMLVERKIGSTESVTDVIESLASVSTLVGSEAWPKLAGFFLQTAATYPKVHPFVPLLVETLAEEGAVVDFWSELAPKLDTGRNETCLGLHYLTLVLPHLKKAAHFEAVFTPEVLSLIMKVAQLEAVSGKLKRVKQERLITGRHKPVQALMSAIVSKFSTADNALEKSRKALIKIFVTPPGSVDFDKKVGGKVLYALLWGTKDMKTVKMVANHCRELLTMKMEVEAQEEGSERLPGYQKRLNAANFLARLINHPVMAKEEEDWRWEQLKLIFALGLFKPTKKKSPDFENLLGFQHNWAFNKGSQELSSQLTSCAEMALMQMNQTFPANERKKLLASTLVKIGQLIDGFLNGDAVEPVRQIGDKGREAWEKVWKVVQKIDKKRNKSSTPEKDALTCDMFVVLFMLVSLRLFADDSSVLASLEDLHECYDRAMGKKAAQKNESEDEPHWVRVLTSILLQLLANENRALRSVVTSAFEMLLRDLTEEACDDVMDVIDPPEGEQLLALEDDEEMPESESEAEKELEEEGSEEEEDDDDDEEDDDGEKAVDSRFRDKLKSALGDAAMATDLETINVSDIDESRMEELDEALANVFRSTALGSKNLDKMKKSANQQEVSFRLRAMDLVEAFLMTSTPTYSYRMFTNVLQRLISGLSKSLLDIRACQPLVSRIIAVLNHMHTKKKAGQQRVTPEDPADLVSCLRSVAENMKKSSWVQASTAMSKTCTSLLKDLQRCPNGGAEQVDEILAVYQGVLDEAFVKSETSVPAIFFKDVLTVQWPGCARILPLLAEKAFDSSVRWYRRVVIMNVIRGALKNHSMLKSGGKDSKSCLKRLFDGAVQELNGTSDEATVKTRLLVECFELMAAVLAAEAVVASKKVDGHKEEAKQALMNLGKRIRIKKRSDAWGSFRKLALKVHIPIAELRECNPAPAVAPAPVEEVEEEKPEVEEEKPQKKTPKKRKSEKKAEATEEAPAEGTEETTAEDEQPTKKKTKNLERARKRREEEERRMARFNDGQLGEVDFSAAVNGADAESDES